MSQFFEIAAKSCTCGEIRLEAFSRKFARLRSWNNSNSWPELRATTNAGTNGSPLAILAIADSTVTNPLLSAGHFNVGLHPGSRWPEGSLVRTRKEMPWH
jgi:hypothetical protein